MGIGGSQRCLKLSSRCTSSGQAGEPSVAAWIERQMARDRARLPGSLPSLQVGQWCKIMGWGTHFPNTIFEVQVIKMEHDLIKARMPDGAVQRFSPDFFNERLELARSQRDRPLAPACANDVAWVGPATLFVI